MKKRTAAILLGSLPVLSVACGEAPTERPWTGSVTDSAGVPVVSNPAEGIWGPGGAWEARLVTEFRAGEGDIPLFERIVDMDVDERGRIYVLDGRALRVAVLGPSGAMLRTIGGPGTDDGEFYEAVEAFVTGTELRVVDPDLSRINRFTLDGELLESVPFDLGDHRGVQWQGLEDGSLLVELQKRNTPADTAPLAPNPLVRLGPEGALIDTLAELPRFPLTQPRPETSFYTLFRRETIWHASSTGRVALGSNTAVRIRMLDTTGALVRTVTLPREPEAVDAEDREAYVNAVGKWLVEAGESVPVVSLRLSGAVIGSHYPAFATVFLGPGRSLWVRRFRTADEIARDTTEIPSLASPAWDVFDDRGRYLGVVDLPADVRPVLSRGSLIYAVRGRGEEGNDVLVFRVTDGTD